MNVYDLPAVNALLNSTSAVLLLLGYYFIRQRKQTAHMVCMLSALGTSAIFLCCYLIYHFYAGSISFTHEGWIRWVYFAILISHTVLAIVNLPFIILAVIPALSQRFDRHRKWARIAFPMWLYVSITGVVVYLMLYQWFPSEELREREGRSEGAALYDNVC